jgi:hypothetical protein
MEINKYIGVTPSKGYDASSGRPNNMTSRDIHRKALSIETLPRLERYKWYSIFVYRMKVFLPVVAVFLVILIFAWPFLQYEDLRFRLNFAALSANQKESRL